MVAHEKDGLRRVRYTVAQRAGREKPALFGQGEKKDGSENRTCECEGWVEEETAVKKDGSRKHALFRITRKRTSRERPASFAARKERTAKNAVELL